MIKLKGKKERETYPNIHVITNDSLLTESMTSSLFAFFSTNLPWFATPPHSNIRVAYNYRLLVCTLSALHKNKLYLLELKKMNIIVLL